MELYRDISLRGSGKSTRILKEALEKGRNIAVFTAKAVGHYKAIANAIGIDPNEIKPGKDRDMLYIRDVLIAPLSYYIWAQRYGIYDDQRLVLVDELSLCMASVLNGKFAGYSDNLEHGESHADIF